MSGRSYQDAIGSGRGLNARGDIGGFTEDIGVLAGSGANHHRAGIDADSHCDLGCVDCSLSFDTASRMPRPARAARSASSS
jgi:hypothetical protein